MTSNPITEIIGVGSPPNVDVRFDEMLATLRPVDPRLPVTGLERADHKRLRPERAFTSQSQALFKAPFFPSHTFSHLIDGCRNKSLVTATGRTQGDFAMPDNELA